VQTRVLPSRWLGVKAVSTKPPAFPELNLETLSRVLPTQYRQWLRAAIFAVIGGYSIVLVSLVLEGQLQSYWTAREPYVIGLALLAGLFERRGRLRAAALVLIGAVWIELHITLVEQGVRSIGTSAFCALLVGVAICLGRRVAIGSAASLVVTTPSAVFLGWVLGVSPSRIQGDLAAIIVLVVSIATTAVLLHLFMDAFSRVLLQAERNRSRARELIDDAPDVVIALSDRGTVEDMNPAAERVLLVSRAAAVGKRFDELPLSPLDSEAMGLGKQSRGDLPREYAVTGSGETLEGLFRSVTRADGSAGLLVWLRDVTARNRAQAEAAALQDQLRHSQKLEALGRLAGGVAHDFNNLLTTVGGYADLIARHPDGKIRDVSAELSSIRERGKGLTRQLLAFARKEKVMPQVVDLSDALFSMEGLLSKLLLDHIELELRLEPHTTIFIDPAQFQQLVLNLVANSKDAMPQGGRLRLACDVVDDGTRVDLVVSDTGVGMDATTKSRVFEPFFTTKPRGKGTGLGLSMVHGVVEASQGKIQLESAPGEGTTLTLSWPRHDSSERISGSTPSPPLARHRGTLLVVEGDTAGPIPLVDVLKEAGYDVVATSNGAEALEKVEALRAVGRAPDLVLSDVRMPPISGPKLALELRARVPRLPVLVLSDHHETQGEGTAFCEDMDVLAKPYTTAELLARVERATGRRWQLRARPG
jgi:signal transduction histidine kinase/CheY-like chemotaxis protein